MRRRGRAAALPLLLLLGADVPAWASGLLGEHQRAEIVHKLAAGDSVAVAWRARALDRALASRTAAPQPRQWIRYDRPDPHAPRLGVDEAREDGGLVAAFGIAWWLERDPEALRKAEEFLLAWTRTYVLDRHPGADPDQINRNLHSQEIHFLVQGFLTGYELVRESLSPQAAAEIDAFYRRAFLASDAFMYDEGLNAMYLTPYGNHFTTHLENLAQIAFVLQQPDLVRRVETSFRVQLDWHDLPAGVTPRQFWSSAPLAGFALRHLRDCPARVDRTWPMATSCDFVQRDSLGYHVIALLDLFHTAALARANGLDWFGERGAAGQMLSDGFAMLVPFVADPQQPEFVHSCVERDQVYGGHGWIEQPADTVRALACGSLPYPERFGRARGSGVPRLWASCPLVYLGWPGSAVVESTGTTHRGGGATHTWEVGAGSQEGR